ncbi:MAG: hypothetical protein GY947_12675 [Rhodobacteraceae bacterium]|nr:hypothetical protein [Paracoccaceae bacterium]
MTALSTLMSAVQNGNPETTLHAGSSHATQISDLQVVLHSLGFDAALRWDDFGPDGDYGQATTNALAAFGQRNGVACDGTAVTLELAQLLLKRLQFLDEMHHIRDAIENPSILNNVRRRSGARVEISVLQTILYELGYGEELNWEKYHADGDYGSGTTKAVKAYADKVGVATNGESVPVELATSCMQEFEGNYGPDWHVETPPVIRHSLTVKESSKSYTVSNGAVTKVFKKFRRGCFTYGDQKTASIIDANRPALRALGMTDSALNMMIGVSDNEGNLDAINTWDNAFFTFGMFQWTIGTGEAEGELPSLMKKIRDEDPDVFEAHFGQHGLGVTEATGAVRGFLTLHGRKVKTTSDKSKFRDPRWCFHFWNAGHDLKVQMHSMRHAYARLGTFYRSSSSGFQVFDRHIADFVTSEYGVALILDNHVNRPGYVATCIRKGAERAGLADKNPANWSTSDEQKMIAQYLKVRETHGRSPMTDAAKRATVTKGYVTRGILSDQRGSFQE